MGRCQRCGAPTPLAARTRSSRGWVAGQPKPYCGAVCASLAGRGVGGHSPTSDGDGPVFAQPDGGGRLAVDSGWLASQGVTIPETGARWIGATIEQQADGRRHWLRVVPTSYTGPDWPVVQPAAPVTVTARPVKPRTPDGWERAFIFPDTQIGYRHLRRPDGTPYLDPFHDEQAINCALGVMVAARPDRVIFLGDSLDFPAQSKYVQDPSWAQTTQDAIDRFYRLLATIRAVLPAASIEVLEGNHDLRLPRSVQVNAAASFRLQQAAMPDSWPVLTVPHLCRFADLDVSYHDGYPATRLWINQRLCAVHGHKVRTGASTAAAVIDDERVSVIFGHVHRIELQHKTRHTWAGGRQSLAASPGTLARIDGAVPSVKGGVDALGRPLTSFEDWQQGCAVVTYEPGDGPFSLELVPIHSGTAIFRGQVINAAAVPLQAVA